MKTDLSQYPRIIMGYHGCDRSVADKVFSLGENLEFSENSYDWLGKGIYFWEYGPQRAYEWAKSVVNPAVVGAVIHLGDCFDLLDRKATDILRNLYPAFEATFPTSLKNKQLKEDDPDYLLRHLDCAVINWVLDEFKEQNDNRVNYHSVRGLFQESLPVYKDSAIRLRSHIQIAVRDTSCILKYFEPDLSYE
jgi:hypothetical protein